MRPPVAPVSRGGVAGMVVAGRRLRQQDAARPVILHADGATCWQPQVKGVTMMVNSFIAESSGGTTANPALPPSMPHYTPAPPPPVAAPGPSGSPVEKEKSLEPQKMAEATLTQQLLWGILIGLILVMVLYNLFVYLSTRDKSYLYYVIYTLCIGLTQTSLSGYTYKYLFANSPVLFNKGIIERRENLE